MAVRVERAGPVTTVILDRPDVRNAVNGPTAAILNSSRALVGSWPRCAMPPKMKSEMRSTGCPRWLATIAWESS